MTRMILMIGSSADLYGAPRVLLSSVQVLVDAGFDVVVAVPGEGPLVSLLENAGAEVEVHPDYALRRRHLGPVGLLRFVRNNARLVRWAVNRHRAVPIELVYSNTQSVVAGPMVALLVRRPHLWHVHEILRSPGWLSRALALLARLGSSVIVCPSRAVAENLELLAPGSALKTVVLPNSVAPSGLADLLPPRRGATFRAGCIARLHPGKGQSLAIAAVADARRRGVPVTLDLFGDPAPGNEHIALELRADVRERGLLDAVRFLGFVDDPQAIYSGLDVVIVPSTLPEPFSLVCLEAQLAGRPVVASDEAGPSEVLRHDETGLLVTPGSAVGFADALEQLWADPTGAVGMGSRGRDRVLRLFSPQAYSSGLLAVVNEHVRAVAPS